MAIDEELKRKVIEAWQNAFPQLSLYAQNKLYKVVGSIVIGLELIKLPRTDEYRPHFVIYPLWKEDVKSSLDSPIIIKEYYNKKGLQYSILYERHIYLFNDVLESVKKQTPFSFNGNISYNKLVFVIDECSQTPPLSAAPNSYLQATLQDAKFKISLFVGIAEAKSVLEQINKRRWDANHFKSCGVDVNRWLQGLQESISKRDGFLKQIETNKREKKIAQLVSFDTIIH